MPNNEEYMETIDEEIDDVTVMTVDIDETLSISGEAADAYVVGQRLIALSNDIADVNEKTGADIQVSGSDTTTISDALSDLAGDVSDMGEAIGTLSGATVKTVQGISPVAGAVTLDTLLAAQADVTGDVDALFTA